MSGSDPMTFAVTTADMTDAQLFAAFHAIVKDAEPTDFQRAVLDEAQYRGILKGSEIDAIRVKLR